MPKLDFNKVEAILLKSHFGMGVLLQICCIFSEHLFSRTPQSGCFCISIVHGLKWAKAKLHSAKFLDKHMCRILIL